DASACPGGVGAVAAGRTAGGADFIPPMLTSVIFAAIDQIARGGTQCIVRFPERRHPAVMIVVDPNVEPYFRHPLGMSHGAGPGSPHFLRRAPAAVDDAERIDQLGLPIASA